MCAMPMRNSTTLIIIMYCNNNDYSKIVYIVYTIDICCRRSSSLYNSQYVALVPIHTIKNGIGYQF